MKIFKVLSLIVVFAVNPCLYAKEVEYTGSCTSKFTDKFEECLDAELSMYDNKLNKIYRQFFKRSPHEKLRKIEAQWIKFKESDCDYMAKEVHGGQYYQFIHKACLINKTKERISDLKRSYFYRGWFKEYN